MEVSNSLKFEMWRRWLKKNLESKIKSGFQSHAKFTRLKETLIFVLANVFEKGCQHWKALVPLRCIVSGLPCYNKTGRGIGCESANRCPRGDKLGTLMPVSARFQQDSAAPCMPPRQLNTVSFLWGNSKSSKRWFIPVSSIRFVLFRLSSVEMGGIKRKGGAYKLLGKMSVVEMFLFLFYFEGVFLWEGYHWICQWDHHL